MKTATVRDLRNNFAKISRWIKDGEKVEITSRGVSLAHLVPTPQPKAKKKKLFSAEENRKWMKEVYGDKKFPDSIVLTMREEKDW
jgi:antitoxin (DNA-binding transcriptional repressor) of toxin-antitoxin stability system